jgi:O-antigen/teichoic acid export membrane protein
MADRFFRDVGLYAISTVLPAALGLALVSVFSHAFTTASYGEYSLGLVFVTAISTLSTGWIEQSILRFEPQMETDTLLQNIVTVLVGEFILVVIIGVLAYSVEGLIPSEYGKFLAPVICLALTLSAFRIFQSIYQSKLRSASLTRLKLTRAVLRFAGAIGAAIYILNDITGWLWGAVFAAGTVTLYMILQMDQVRPTFKPDLELIRRMFFFGVPLIGWALAHKLLAYSDRVIIELLRGSASVGIYSSNYTIANQSMGLISGPIIMTIHPLIMNAWTGENPEELSKMIRSYTRYFMIAGIPAIVYSIVLCKPMAEFMLAKSYSDGYLVIPAITAGTFVWGISNVGHKGLEAQEKTTTMLLGAVIAVILNILLNIPLVQRYGYTGAALATLLSFSVYPLYIYVKTSDRIRWRIPVETARNVVLATAPIFLLYLILWLTTSYNVIILILVIPMTGLLYFAALYVLNEPNEEELAVLSRGGRQLLMRISQK